MTREVDPEARGQAAVLASLFAVGERGRLRGNHDQRTDEEIVGYDEHGLLGR